MYGVMLWVAVYCVCCIDLGRCFNGCFGVVFGVWLLL